MIWGFLLDVTIICIQSTSNDSYNEVFKLAYAVFLAKGDRVSRSVAVKIWLWHCDKFQQAESVKVSYLCSKQWFQKEK